MEFCRICRVLATHENSTYVDGVRYYCTEHAFPEIGDVPISLDTIPSLGVGAIAIEPDPFPSGTSSADAPEPLLSEDPDAPVLTTDEEERKNTPIFSGVLNYFPLAIAAVARLSKRGNDKHNPGQPLHWARDKSTDQEDCIGRHLIDIDTVNPKTGEFDDAVALAWRALAALQEREEKRLGKAQSRGSR